MLRTHFKPFLLLISSLWAFSTSAVQSDAARNCTSAAIPYPVVEGAEITSLVVSVVSNFSDASPAVDVCLVNITLTHPGTGDNVTTWIALPLTDWNGIFQGVGGGGYQAGTAEGLAPAAATGYSAGATDSGHTSSAAYESDATVWALASPGNVNQYLLLDFARRSLHDMNVIGKAVTESFYGVPAKYAYWNGCSTGGRQGLIHAQYYPDDYDGIVADAPAVQWNDFTPAQQWPYTVMNNEDYAPTVCELNAVVAEAIAACDGLDGQLDGIISAPAICNFTVQSIVGQPSPCNGTTSTYSQKLADVVDKFWTGAKTPEGQFLWYGITKGANLTSQAVTTIAANGSSIAEPFGISDSWYRGFLAKDITFDTAQITYAEFAGPSHSSVLTHITY